MPDLRFFETRFDHDEDGQEQIGIARGYGLMVDAILDEEEDQWVVTMFAPQYALEKYLTEVQGMRDPATEMGW